MARKREQAKPDSWQTKPMPEAKVRLQIDRTFSADDYAKLQLGSLPRMMEDKWFIYFEDDWLHFHRSWTGFCIFQVRLESVEGGYQISEAWASRDPRQYKQTNDAEDVALIADLIDDFLLREQTDLGLGIGGV